MSRSLLIQGSKFREFICLVFCEYPRQVDVGVGDAANRRYDRR